MMGAGAPASPVGSSIGDFHVLYMPPGLFLKYIRILFSKSTEAWAPLQPRLHRLLHPMYSFKHRGSLAEIQDARMPITAGVTHILYCLFLYFRHARYGESLTGKIWTSIFYCSALIRATSLSSVERHVAGATRMGKGIRDSDYNPPAHRSGRAEVILADIRLMRGRYRRGSAPALLYSTAHRTRVSRS